VRRFQFSLEALLQVKQHQLDVLQAEIAELERRQNDRRVLLTRLGEELENTAQSRMTSILAGIDADSLQEYFHRWVYLFECIQRLDREIHDSDIFLESRRDDYRILYREHQMLEEMKSRARQQWWETVLKEEQKTLDEFGTLRFVRNTGSF